MRKSIGALAVASVALIASSLVTGTSEAASTTGDPVIGAVGDMACDPASSNWNGGAGTATACGEQRTSDAMVADTSLDAVLGLGDYQYDCDASADYPVSYTPTWGRLNPLMDPVAGNHEYLTGTNCPADNTTAANYFSYFGAAAHPETQGHFSFNLGSWHIIGLNGNCARTGGCKSTSAQTKWLIADLAANSQPCTLAYWHQPLYTGIQTGKNLAYQPWWNALYAAHADVVLNGHVHNYQRFAPMNANGVLDPLGPTEYIVGTGGEGQVAVKASVSPQPVANAKTFGYLRMTLLPAGWTADFVRYDGTVLDSSVGTCHSVL